MTAAPAERRALWFAGLLVALCLLLQRFGVPFGGKQISIVGPLGVALVGWGLFTGTLAFHRGRLMLYLLLVAFVLLGLAMHTAMPGGGVEANYNSLAQFLLLTAFATFTFAAPLDEAAFFRVITGLLLAIGVAGIVQFAAQFAGLHLFSFTGLLPDTLLFESGYNLEIPVGFGSLLKSNGFVLVEPSVLSQMMALGLIIEAVAFRRLPYLAVFATALLLSFSGTGWIVLAAFVFSASLAMGRRGLVVATGIVLLLGTTLAVAALVAPDILGALASRLDELSHPGTSGHMRFITPFWMLSDVMSSDPAALLWGIGSGASERLSLPYDYDVNTPIKVMTEYGAPALAAYVLLFVYGGKSRVQAALVFPAVLLFMVTGGYQQFPPMVFLILLLTSVARLSNQAQARARATSPVSIAPASAAPAAR